MYCQPFTRTVCPMVSKKSGNGLRETLRLDFTLINTVSQRLMLICGIVKLKKKKNEMSAMKGEGDEMEGSPEVIKSIFE